MSELNLKRFEAFCNENPKTAGTWGMLGTLEELKALKSQLADREAEVKSLRERDCGIVSVGGLSTEVRHAELEGLRKAAEELLKSKMSAVPSGVFVGVEEYHALRAALGEPGAKEEHV